MKLKKFKLLRFGKCYLSKDGALAIALAEGDRKKGYLCAVSSSKFYVGGRLHIQSRIIPNDGVWYEIPVEAFRDIAYVQSHGVRVVAMPTLKAKTPPPTVKYVKARPSRCAITV